MAPSFSETSWRRRERGAEGREEGEEQGPE